MHGTVVDLKSGKPHFLIVTSWYQTKKNAGNTGLALTAFVLKLEPQTAGEMYATML